MKIHTGSENLHKCRAQLITSPTALKYTIKYTLFDILVRNTVHARLFKEVIEFMVSQTKSVKTTYP
jgi:hypothetical protein